MRFPYPALRTRRPVYSLAGAMMRHLSIFSVTLLHSGRMFSMDGLLDSASSDTIFPLARARNWDSIYPALRPDNLCRPAAFR